MNAHTDEVGSPTADAVIQSAQAHHVPIVDTARLLDFTDGRDGSSFAGIEWNQTAGTLTFNLSLAAHSEGLDAMVPLVSADGQVVASISIDGKAVEFTRELIAGVYYARFEASAGAVVVQYGPGGAELKLAALSPGPEAGNVAIDVAMTATFDRTIDSGTLSFYLRDFNGAVIPGTVVYDSSRRTATLTPSEVLRGGFPYTAYVSALDEQGGGAMARAWTFTTALPDFGAGPYSFWNTSQAPVCGDSTEGRPMEVGVQFSSDVAGMVTGIRFYKDAANVGTHEARLWRDGRLLASAPFSDETSEGWQTVSFPEPIAIAKGAVYTASYHSDSGHYAFTHEYFAGQGVHRGPLHAMANGMVSAGNGVYADSGRSNNNEIGRLHLVPDQTYRASNYWVDVIFVPMSRGELSAARGVSP